MELHVFLLELRVVVLVVPLDGRTRDIGLSANPITSGIEQFPKGFGVLKKKKKNVLSAAPDANSET